ncbi:unnamed protein product [Spirodela intermedia]|uniref:Uncharacterized protein n=1 Tax=Spirodela intermedia TaxID=51605 RepID=A0A7I8JQS5_SPIIN|nr:unnamed protein product [Spirodela intermedia]CAA6672121.1 unnamed protein product [Spirodela intermedia]
MAFYGSLAWSGAGEVMECVPATAKRKASPPEDMIDDFPFFSPQLTRNLQEEATVAAVACGQPSVEEKPPRLDESRAIVLYKPVDRPIFDYPPSLNALLRVGPDLISGLKVRLVGPTYSGNREEGEPSTDDREAAAFGCSLALVPWAPPRPSSRANAPSSPHSRPYAAAAAATGLSEGFRHWNQHCLPPQLSPGASTPAVMWTWGYERHARLQVLFPATLPTATMQDGFPPSLWEMIGCIDHYALNVAALVLFQMTAALLL